MQILYTKTYEQELKEILSSMASDNFDQAKKFKTYLDAIIINIPTKASKYEKSIHFYDDNVKDVECEDYTVIFYFDDHNNNYVILSIIKK